MPWTKMRLRGAEVFVRVDDAGRPLAQRGRVEVRYRSGPSRAYHAAPGNLEAIAGAPRFDDAHCPDEAPAAASAGPSPAASAKPAARATRGVQTPASAGAAPKDAVIAYADGACSGNPGPAGLGLVLLDGPTRLERSEYLGTGTNNIAELVAIQRALEAVEDPARPLWIHTDSQYSIGVLSLGWKPKANQALIAGLKALLATRPAVRLIHVRGHAGVVLNERADELAREAVTSRATREQRFTATRPEAPAP